MPSTMVYVFSLDRLISAGVVQYKQTRPGHGNVSSTGVSSTGDGQSGLTGKGDDEDEDEQKGLFTLTVPTPYQVRLLYITHIYGLYLYVHAYIYALYG